jgi:hypothetical protein
MFPRPADANLYRLPPSAVRKQRPFADGLAKVPNRPEGDFHVRRDERLESERKHSSAEGVGFTRLRSFVDGAANGLMHYVDAIWRIDARPRHPSGFPARIRCESGQLIGAPRTFLQQIGDPQCGRDIDRSGDEEALDHSRHGRRHLQRV